MRYKLPIAMSAIALVAGTSLALGQGMKERGGPPAVQPGPPASQGAPAEKMAPGTTGQGSGSETPKSDQAPSRQRDTTGQGSPRQTPNREMKGNQEPSKQQAPSTQQAPSKQKDTTGQGPAGASGASLTVEQRTQITTIIKKRNVRPVTKVNFSIAIGAVVPASVHFYPLPVEVVEIYPEWRGYLYILVGDEIFIIHPATHRIVAIIEA